MLSTLKNADYDHNSKVSIASHSRSESSSSFQRHEQVNHADGSQHPSSKPESTRNSSRLDYFTTSPPPLSQTPCPPERRQKFRLGKLKPTWGEKRPNKPTIHRCCSSPVLTSPVDPLSPNKKKPSLLVKKSSKNLRKTASVPSGLGNFFVANVLNNTVLIHRLLVGPSPPSRPLEKKKSQPLRTQPYEAPYFFPPPMPIEKIPSRGQLPRSHTLPPRNRQRSPSAVHKLPEKASSLA